MKKVTKKARIKKGSPWINDDGDELKVNDVTVDKADGVTYVHYEYLSGGIDFTDDATFLWLFKPKGEPLTQSEAGL